MIILFLLYYFYLLVYLFYCKDLILCWYRINGFAGLYLTGVQMTLLFRMDDRMNRQLSSTITQADRALALAEELVHYGFINEVKFHFCFIS